MASMGFEPALSALEVSSDQCSKGNKTSSAARLHAAPPGNTEGYGEFIKFYQTFVS